MNGVIALVTGGASGLGLGVVRRFVRQGAKVAIVDLPKSKGYEVAQEQGDSVIFTPADVTSPDEMDTVLKETVSKFGKLNVVVNAAGVACAFKIFNANTKEVHKIEDFSKVMNVNVIGTFNVIRLALPYIHKNTPNTDGERGVIVNTASIAAYDGQMGQVAYSASKGAIVAMTLPLARDLAKIGVRVATIAPGLFDTPLLGSLPEKVRTFLLRTVPFPGRLGQPDEYAQLAQHIVENPYMNGEVIRLDGAIRMQP